jgi:superoxide dismutase, Fe-Mn family
MIALTLALSISSCTAFISRASVIVNPRTGESTSLSMGIELPALPYPYDSLAPFLGEQTLRIHHDKHHAKYVTVANGMIAGTDMEKDDVITILRKAYGKNQALFNNAAQSYNHAFYWECMKPGGGGKPTGKLMDLIAKQWGDFDKFRAEFVTAGTAINVILLVFINLPIY